jgi:hypothetical protein
MALAVTEELTATGAAVFGCSPFLFHPLRAGGIGAACRANGAWGRAAARPPRITPADNHRPELVGHTREPSLVFPKFLGVHLVHDTLSPRQQRSAAQADTFMSYIFGAWCLAFFGVHITVSQYRSFLLISTVLFLL